MPRFLSRPNSVNLVNARLVMSQAEWRQTLARARNIHITASHLVVVEDDGLVEELKKVLGWFNSS